MKVLDYVVERVSRGKVHMTLIDPDKQSAAEAGGLASLAAEAGTDAIMVGGSTGVTQAKVDGTVRAIKAACTVPVILFPGGASSLSRHADAVYYMSLLNSRSIRLIVGEQRRAVRAIRAWGLEPIPMAYLIVEPGMRAGEIGEADPIPRSRPEVAVDWALTAQYLGMRLVYLESGSGAPEPAPPAMVRAVKEAIQIPLIVGGGIRTPASAAAVAKAGADILVTGTVVEETKDAAALRDIVAAVKGR
jgi:phosphoglycerol geranylgeranyltransferase